MSSKHYLPPKVGSYLKRLELEYRRTDQRDLIEVITSARVTVFEGTSYDNWNGGTYEHDVILFLPADLIGELGFDAQKQIGKRLCHDLNQCVGAATNESFGAVHLELADESDPEYQRALTFARQPQTNPETVSFWKQGCLRLFISHRDTHKIAARKLAEALSDYGISAFVAHDTIEPLTTWQREIEKGLETMEVMLAFVTDDFHDSVWTNQEIGYALGKAVPIITIKLGRKDPLGFIATKQAMKGNLDRIEEVAPAVYALLSQKLGQKGRLQQVLISAFTSSPTWDAARERFDRMRKAVSNLSDDEVAQIQAAYAKNPSLNGAFYLSNHHNRLTNFMKRSTGREFEIKGNELKIKNAKSTSLLGDDIPF